MQWVEIGDKKNLHDAVWVMTQMKRLLRLQASGEVSLGAEGYLTHPNDKGFTRAITMSAWMNHPSELLGVLGAKWVSSHPPNTAKGLPRGQAVTMLNCAETGLPLLVFDGTDLSNARTAAFACAAIDIIYSAPTTIALIGAGRVHEWQAEYIRQLWPSTELWVYDTDDERMERFATRFNATCLSSWWFGCEFAEVVSVATAGAEDGWIPAGITMNAKLWINTSLRDVTPAFFKRFAWVVVDDFELAATGRTPYHEAYLARDLPLLKRLCDITKPIGYPVIVNPMGLALWDVGLGYALFQDEFRVQQQRLYTP